MYLIEKATIADVDELTGLYDLLNDNLEQNTNYPGWIKGIYPVRETAVQGIEKNALFVLRVAGRIVGSVILNNEPEEAYKQVIWGVEAKYEDIIVVHTLVVHPLFMQKGLGKALLNFAKEYSIKQNAKAIRLDVSINNKPAIALYEKCGYCYVDTVDLGLNIPHLIWFKLYEIAL